MIPQNRIERQKMKSKFLLIYVLSMLLLFSIFAALWPAKSIYGISDLPASQKEKMQIAEADSFLHLQLLTLQRLDEKSLDLFTDSVYKNNEALLQQHMRQIDSSINISEHAIADNIDKLRRMAKLFTGIKNRNYTDSLVSGYNVALKNHRSLNNIRSVIGMNLDTDGDNAALFAKLQAGLQSKDRQIAKLESQLHNFRIEKSNENPVVQTAAINTEEWRKQTERAEYLAKENRALQQDNDRLLLEFGKLRKSSEVELVQKQAETRQQMNNLTAQLYLAQVDCNLTRADAKHIVYNSKQRRELLAEAMKILNNLAGAGDETFQQKVREKTNQLRFISNAIRD